MQFMCLCEPSKRTLRQILLPQCCDKWVLEEKQKVKPRNAAEKKKLDEEKALLKEFIRAGSLPSL